MPELGNTGVILVDLEPEDLIFGANTRVKHNIVIDGKWLGYYSSGELQYSIYFDSQCCVSFAAIKIVSAIMNYKIRLGLLSKSNLNWLKENKYINDKGEFDASERFTGAMSGTTERGNSGRKVWDSIRNHGLVPQHLCDWDRGRDVEYDKRFGAWFRDIANITQEAKDIGLEFKRRFNVFYEAVLFDTESKKEEALKHSPIEVFIPTSCKYKGTVQQYCDGTIGHAVSRVEYFNPKGYVPLFDHYIKQPKEEGNERFVRRVVSNYKYHPYGYVCTIEENNMENDFVKIVKDEDSKAVGFFIPATSPDALETMSKAFNKDIVKKADGSVDWSKTIEGKVKFNS